MSPPMSPEDYPLLRSQAALLALALRLVTRDGYRYWLTQTAPADRILTAVEKIDEQHAVLLSPQARKVRREARLPVAHLLLAPPTAAPQGGRWPMLLLSDRRLRGENMRPVEGRRPLTWVAWRKDDWRPTYELRRDKRGKLTWFLVEDYYEDLRKKALTHARAHDWPRLVQTLKTLGNLPMFTGIYIQATTIKRHVMREWGNEFRRNPSDQWRSPPWRKALEGWPKRPWSPVGIRLYRDEPPRTLGEWVSMHE